MVKLRSNLIKKSLQTITFFQLTLLSFLAVGVATALADPMQENVFPEYQMHFNTFNADNIPVCRCRVFEVKAPNEDIAKTFLGAKEFILLSLEQSRKMLPSRNLDLQQILEVEANSREKYALERESFAGKHPHDEAYANIAREYRDLANYTKKLKPAFKPYLIRVKVYARGTGNFLISLKKNTLDIYHGSLSQNELPEHYMYIVVYLEREIDSVVVNAGFSS